MAKKKDFKSTKVKKKQWVQVLAPEAFKSVPLGQTHVDEKESVVGKHLTLNLMTVTNDPKKQGLAITFKVSKLSGENAQTEFVGFKMLPGALKRIVRRNRNRIDNSFVCKTKDEKNVRIKPILVTRTKGTSQVVRFLRKQVSDAVRKLVAEYDTEKLAHDIVFHKFQQQLKEKVHKIHPVAAVEVREVKIVVPKRQ